METQRETVKPNRTTTTSIISFSYQDVCIKRCDITVLKSNMYHTLHYLWPLSNTSRSVTAVISKTCRSLVKRGRRLLRSRRAQVSKMSYFSGKRQQQIILEQIEALCPKFKGDAHVDEQLSRDFQSKVAIQEDTGCIGTDQDAFVQCNGKDDGFTFATPHNQDTYPELPTWWNTKQPNNNKQQDHSVSDMQDVCSIHDKENINPNTPGGALKKMRTAMDADTACWGPVKRSRPKKSCIDPMDCSPTIQRKKIRVRRTLMEL